jgi:Bifunctional DNA primase/polymerase, N-terminal
MKIALPDVADSLITRGWFLLPLWGIYDGKCECGKNCGGNAGKHPIGALVPHGLKDSSNDPEIIRGWFERYPNMNLGVHCGPSGLLVVDLDGPDGIAAWGDLADGRGGDTYAVHTGRGMHIYYQLPEGEVVPPSVKRLGPGIDVRAGDSYVVAEGSLHARGVRYQAVTV